MPRAWVWLQLVLGWLPVWALYTTLILTAHPGTPVPMAALRGLWAIGVAALLGLGVWRVTSRLPWPHPFRWRFGAAQLGLAALYAGLFALFTYGLDTNLHHAGVSPGDAASGHLVTVAPVNWLLRFLVFGAWLYVLVAGVAYATRGTERAARAEALAAEARLAALRAQLDPHFLFNALHTVVHLIPREPARASQAAERLAGLLRTSLEEDRDLVSLTEEWRFVERYLEIERIRFGDRLRTRIDLDPEAESWPVPAFALQTLVENAVRHGAAPSVEPTEIAVTARVNGDRLTLSVHDTGPGAPSRSLPTGSGTGLARLRDRLAALYGEQARLDLAPGGPVGFAATLTIPRGAEI